MRLLVALLVALVSLPLPAQPARTLEIGVVPTLPAGTLLDTYQPLAAGLARHLHRPAQIVTAPDIPSFQQRTLQGDYDLVVTGPLQGLLAATDADYQVILQSARPVQAAVLVRRDSGIARLRDLRGREVATMDARTLIAQLGADMLRKAGLRPGQNVTLRHERSPNNAVQSMLRGEVAAAIVTAALLKALPVEDLDRLHGIAESARYPGMLVLARRGGDRPPPAAWVAAIREFAASPGGQRLVGEIHGGLEAPDLGGLKRLAPLLAEQRGLID